MIGRFQIEPDVVHGRPYLDFLLQMGTIVVDDDGELLGPRIAGTHPFQRTPVAFWQLFRFEWWGLVAILM
jgi:hypothetical protein